MTRLEQIEEVGSDEQGREFERLPRRTQIRRLRRLAEIALADYDLPLTRLKLLVHLFNTTFVVDTATGERYVLHIRRARATTLESAASELAWLAALRRDTALEVPDPVPTRSGSLLTMATAPGVSRPHICVLFRWMPGLLLRHGLTTAQMERAGEFMGRLQNHASEWRLPPGFVRGRVDCPLEAARWLPDPFAPEIIASIQALVADSLSTAEAEQVMDALERVRAVEEALRGEQVHGPATFGLIHADLHYRNLLFFRGTVRAIDFDDCGFGPWLYDPSVMLSAVLDWEDYPALRAALLAGYRRVRSISAEHEALLDTFIALRQMQDALWVLEWREHPAIREDWASLARGCLAPVASLMTVTDIRR